MFSLKSELFKKQQELTSKSNNEATGVIRKQHKIKSADDTEDKSPSYVKNPGVEERCRKDIIATSEEEDKEKKVQSVLQAKAKLYEKMTSGDILPDEESSSIFLVDFEQKSIEARLKKSGDELEAKPRVGVNVASELKKASAPADDDWIEYVDSLGRSRTCLRKDLPSLKKMDDKLNVDRRAKQQADTSTKTLLSDDMRREMRREEWEKEAMEEVNGPLHYENLRQGEIRELGVGYYSFSTDQETRDSQMKMLLKMREETKKEKENLKEIQSKKRSALLARLEKVQQRRIKKLKAQGKEVPPELLKPIELPPVEEEKKETIEDRDLEAEVEVTVVKDVNKLGAEREWDKGKDWSPAVPSKPPKSWKDPREERLDEFAPPSFYYNHTKNRGRDKGRNLTSKTSHNNAGTSFPGETNNHDSAEIVNDESANIIHQLRQEVSSNISETSKNLQVGTHEHEENASRTDQKTVGKSTSDIERMNRLLNSLEHDPVQKSEDNVAENTDKPYVPCPDKPITMKIKTLPKKNKVLDSKPAFTE